MTLKDRFITQSAPDTCRKLRKQAFGPNQSLKNCYSWHKWYIMVENMRRKIRGKKKKRAMVGFSASRKDLSSTLQIPSATTIICDAAS